jgi:hypothetical protein
MLTAKIDDQSHDRRGNHRQRPLRRMDHRMQKRSQTPSPKYPTTYAATNARILTTCRRMPIRQPCQAFARTRIAAAPKNASCQRSKFEFMENQLSTSSSAAFGCVPSFASPPRRDRSSSAPALGPPTPCDSGPAEESATISHESPAFGKHIYLWFSIIFPTRRKAYTMRPESSAALAFHLPFTIHLESAISESMPNDPQFDPIEDAIKEIRAGRMVVVTDDADRENEGDLVMAAEKITPAAVNFMATHGRGLICAPITEERAAQLGLQRMVLENRESYRTDFTVSVDAATGVTTGISAPDRARTIQLLVDPKATPQDLVQPGHVFPLRAKAGGVLRGARPYRGQRGSRPARGPPARGRPLRNPQGGRPHGPAARAPEVPQKARLEDVLHPRPHRLSPQPGKARGARANHQAAHGLRRV